MTVDAWQLLGRTGREGRRVYAGIPLRDQFPWVVKGLKWEAKPTKLRGKP